MYSPPPNDAHWFWLGLLLLLMFGVTVLLFALNVFG
jgi:hypothetical protein